MNEERNVGGDVYKVVRSFFGELDFCIDVAVHSYLQRKVDKQIWRMDNGTSRDSLEYSVIESLRRNIQNSYSR